ncbi:MAG: tetratricopeptide repeat protein, partial [Gemmatimonadota bacterium]|nr:tetratricopeptide repeat protein [Gemmatimonadota bacterium]
MLDICRTIGVLMVLSFGCGQEEMATPSADYVSAFYTGVFALEVGAFDRADASLSRALTMEPDEPAAWANRGVLRLRRGDYDGAAKDLETARSLMPESGDIAMLQGLVERSRGQSDAAIAFFEEAAQQGLVKAQYALMKEVERQGEAGSEEEVWAQLGVLIRQVPDNPVLWVERARQAGKRGDEEALRASVEKLGEWAESWSEAARVQLRSLQGETDGGSEVALQAMFLHNVLLRDPMYRRALDALIVPAERLGDPVVEFLKFSMPQAMPTPADLNMYFEPESVAGLEGSDWQVLKPFWSEEEVEVVAASASQVRGVEGIAVDSPGVLGMVTVDWNNDFALDLALVGAEGFRLFRRTEDGGVEDVTDSIGLDKEDYFGVWGADVEMDGDVDFVLGRSTGPPLVLQNNGDGSFVARELFGNVDGLRGFVWVDCDGDGDPDAAMLDREGQLIEAVNERAGVFTPGVKKAVNGVAIGAGDLDRDGRLERVVVDRDGAVMAVSQGEIRTLIQGDSTAGPAPLLIADLDNNGALDLVFGKRAYLASEEAYHALDLQARVTGVADLTGDGRLDLLGVSDAGEALQLVNRGDLAYHWQAIRPVGGRASGDGRINALGLGAEVELRSGAFYQKQMVTDPVVHFGLGTYTGADLVRIVWPNG